MRSSGFTNLRLALGVAFLLGLPFQTSKAQAPSASARQATASQNQLRMDSLEVQIDDCNRRLDSISRNLANTQQFLNDQIGTIDRFYDRTLAHVYWVVGAGALFISVVVALFGAIVPTVQQRRAKDELSQMIKTQSDDFDARLHAALHTIQSHSERMSLALSNYALGTFNLAKASLTKMRYVWAFNDFSRCLRFLTQLMATEQLPPLYVTCLHSLAQLSFLRWGQMYQPEVLSVRESLQFLKRVWKEDEAIMSLVHKVEIWLDSPAEQGKEIEPTSV